MSDSLQARVESWLWEHTEARTNHPARVALKPARLAYAVVRDVTQGQLTLRAMSLVYTTLLSVVPLLAFAFSVLKGFGVHRQIEPLLYEFLQPLGEQGVQITDQIISFVENIRGGVLGGIGLAFLLFTVISMIQKVEDTFNYIWQVQRSRSIGRRFSDYLSVLLVGPVLMVTAMGLLATINSSTIMQNISGIEPFGTLLEMVARLAPLAIVVLVFAFVYAFIPNTRVKLTAAIAGAAIAGLAWTLGGSLFASSIAGSTRYAAIYSSFAIALFALIWLYLSWLILLIGAQIAFYVQYPERQRLGRDQVRVSIARAEYLALRIMRDVGCAFRRGEQVGFEALAERLGQSARSLEDITTLLEGAGLLTQTEAGCFVPGRDPATISLESIFAAVRGEDPADGQSAVADVLGKMRAAEAEHLEGRSLADLVARDDAARAG